MSLLLNLLKCVLLSTLRERVLTIILLNVPFTLCKRFCDCCENGVMFSKRFQSRCYDVIHQTEIALLLKRLHGVLVGML